MKRLIIFADGTWNTPGNRDGSTVAPTNVYKAFIDTIPDTCKNGDEQIVYYQEGVGTEGASDHAKGGLFGKGIDINIKNLYRFIVENYTPGTELFLFGFSRGSYTVRSLAGLIRNCGILKKYNHQKVDRAYFIYRSKDDKYHPNSEECLEFQKHFSHPLDKSPIKFIGVWDTVGALGVPFSFFTFSNSKYRFHDVKLSFLIENAYHAVSINENRVFFRPTLWQKEKGEKFEKQNLEQCWFRGVHCDVGGGYSNGDVAKIPMHYLIEKARKLGLQCTYSTTVAELKKANDADQNESWTSYYRALPRYYRKIDSIEPSKPGWKYKFDKWVFNLIMKKEGVLSDGLPTHEYLHESVKDWSAKQKKLPLNLRDAVHQMQQKNRILPY